MIGFQQANTNTSNDLSLDDPRCADKKNSNLHFKDSRTDEIVSSEISRPTNVPQNAKKTFTYDSSSDVEGEISNHFASCSLFEKDDNRLSVFKNASARAKELINSPREVRDIS